VRNRATWPQPIFCPVNVLARRKPCSAVSSARKPLSLWSKLVLSTVRRPFTIYYQFKYLSKLTNTKKPLRVEKLNTARRKCFVCRKNWTPASRREQRSRNDHAARSRHHLVGKRQGRHDATVLMSSERKWNSRDRGKERRQGPADSLFYAKQTS
jgi:hypothetical protein